MQRLPDFFYRIYLSLCCTKRHLNRNRTCARSNIIDNRIQRKLQMRKRRIAHFPLGHRYFVTQKYFICHAGCKLWFRIRVSNRRTASGANSILASSNGVPVTICSSGYDRSVPTCSTICSQPYELNVWQISLTLPFPPAIAEFPVSADRLQKVAVLSVQAHKCCILPGHSDFGTEINQRRNSRLYTDRKSASSARTA